MFIFFALNLGFVSSSCHEPGEAQAVQALLRHGERDASAVLTRAQFVLQKCLFFLAAVKLDYPNKNSYF